VQAHQKLELVLVHQRQELGLHQKGLPMVQEQGLSQTILLVSRRMKMEPVLVVQKLTEQVRTSQRDRQ
jgi:hypothetical protein